jgi:hypothetical protein
MAYWRRKPANKVMLHSDQGSQYETFALNANLSSTPVNRVFFKRFLGIQAKIASDFADTPLFRRNSA